MCRLVGTQQWTIMDTHSNKTSYKLTVLKPDTTYQVKILTQCLSKLHKTNEMITVRTPEGCEFFFFGCKIFIQPSLCVLSVKKKIQVIATDYLLIDTWIFLNPNIVDVLSKTAVNKKNQ